MVSRVPPSAIKSTMQAPTGDALSGNAKEGDSIPSHLIPQADGQWALWRTVCLRGAGFPVNQVLKLAATECADAADRLNIAQSELAQARTQALHALRRRVKDQDEEESAVLEKAIKKIKKGKPPEFIVKDSGLQAMLGKFTAAVSQIEELRADFQRTFDDALKNTSLAIRETVKTPRFCEALIWQNRNAFHTAVKPLLRQPEQSTARGSKHRQHEELVANYLQRYCVKNDTIGFFGPVGWAHFVLEGEAITALPGPHLIASRGIHFEAWAIDALARTLMKNASVKPWVAPRCMPFTHLEQSALHLPGGKSIKLSAREIAILKSCDGWQTAKALTRKLQSPAFGFKNEREVYDLLELLVVKGAIAWTLEVPVQQDSEQTLRTLINQIGEEPLRRLSLDALAEFETARDAVAGAAGSPELLDEALGALDAKFSSVTGVASTRAPGETYAARTLVYLDCRRDIDVDIGPELLHALEPPLSLVLACARWVTYEVARIYRRATEEIYTELAKKTGCPIVNATDFWMKCDPILFKEGTRVGDSIVSVLQRRWSDILHLKPGESRAQYSSAELRPGVRAAFNAPRPGWNFARYHSPDVMIAASGPEAIRRGDYQLVLGEIHLGINTLLASLFLAQHPSPESIFQMVESDFSEPGISPVLPKQWPAHTARTCAGFVPRKNHRLEVSHDSCGIPKSQSLPIGSLVLEKTDGNLTIRTRDGRLRYDVVEAFGEVLSGIVLNFFRILKPAEHTPRVTIDKLIVSRETWHVSTSEMSFAYEKEEAGRFLATRSWRRERGLPRFVFVKAPVELKPFYVDFDSPIYVSIFAKVIRRNKESGHANQVIKMVEMIPAHDELWLSDIKDRRFASELRIVAVDLAK